MTYNQGCDSTAQPMRAGGSDISQRAGSQGSWTTGLLHINSMGSNQASNPHPRVWPLSRIAPGRSYWADAGTVSSGSPSPAKCCWSQQPRPGSGVPRGREAVRGGGRPPGSSSTSRGRLPAPVAEGPAPGPGGSQSGRSGDGGRKSTERSVGTASATRMRSLTSRTGRPPASTSSRTSTSRTPARGSSPTRTRPGQGAGGTTRPGPASPGTPRDAARATARCSSCPRGQRHDRWPPRGPGRTGRATPSGLSGYLLATVRGRTPSSSRFSNLRVLHHDRDVVR